MNTTTTSAVFQFHTHQVRTIIKDGEPWFVASDVAKALDYRDAEVAARHLDDDEKVVHLMGVPPVGKEFDQFQTNGGPQRMTIISESGLYALVLRSRKPEARKFAKWVTSEVLPAIRKTGEYRAPYTAGPHDVLTASQAEQLRIALKEKCATLPKEKQGAFMLKAWSKLKSHFGVTYRNIPQREFTEALSLVARHSAEWELVDGAPQLEDATPAAAYTSLNQREFYSEEEVNARIRARAWQLAGLFANKWVDDMSKPSQFHYFRTGDNAPEAWKPQFGSSDAISTLETLSRMAAEMSENAMEKDGEIIELLESSIRINGYETRRAA